jgi:hypothetical protein
MKKEPLIIICIPAFFFILLFVSILVTDSPTFSEEDKKKHTSFYLQHKGYHEATGKCLYDLEFKSGNADIFFKIDVSKKKYKTVLAKIKKIIVEKLKEEDAEKK